MRFILSFSLVLVVVLASRRVADAIHLPSESRNTASDSARSEPAHELCRYGAVTPIVDTPEFRQVVRHVENDSTLTISNVERRGPGAAEEVSDRSFRTDYAIRAVAGRQAYEFYVLGRSAAGECIVERWTPQPPRGSYTLRRERANTPIGVPVDGVPAIRLGIEGGEYVPIADRVEPNANERTVLLRTKELGMPHGIACDPEGRFLLLLCGDEPRTVHQLALTANAEPIALFDSDEIEHLRHCEALHARQHPTRGRAYSTHCLWCPVEPEEHTTFLFDADNDGRFDGHETWTDDECAERGHALDAWVIVSPSD